MVLNKKYVFNILENAFVLLVSFSMLSYGIGKIVQFKGAYLDLSCKLVSELTGQQLMWAFYGYSYNFSLLIVFFEIIGAILIFYRKTRLIGSIFTSFILCNIIIQDYIFDIIALKTAIFYQVLLLIIMFFNKKKLEEAFRSLLIQTEFLFNRELLIKCSLSIFIFFIMKFLEVYFL